MNKCKTCKHFTAKKVISDIDGLTEIDGFGTCALMGDSNEGIADTTRAYGWDYEGYVAGVHVGENFGCIHWMARRGYE